MAAIPLHGTDAFGVFCHSPGAAACYELRVLGHSACSTMVAPNGASSLVANQQRAGLTTMIVAGEGGRGGLQA